MHEVLTALLSLFKQFDYSEPDQSKLIEILSQTFPFLSTSNFSDEFKEFLESISVLQYYQNTPTALAIAAVKILLTFPDPLTNWLLVRLEPALLEASECIPTTEPRHFLFKECSAGFAQLVTNFLSLKCDFNSWYFLIGEYDLDPYRTLSLAITLLCVDLDVFYKDFSKELKQDQNKCHVFSLPRFIKQLFSDDRLTEIVQTVFAFKFQQLQAHEDGLGLFLASIIFSTTMPSKTMEILVFLIPFVKEEHRPTFLLATAIIFSTDSFSSSCHQIPENIETFINRHFLPISSLSSSSTHSYAELVQVRLAWLHNLEDEELLFKYIVPIIGSSRCLTLLSVLSLSTEHISFTHDQTQLDLLSFQYFPSSLLISLVERNYSSLNKKAILVIGLGLCVCIRYSPSQYLHQTLWNNYLSHLPILQRFKAYDFAISNSVGLDPPLALKRLMRRISADNLETMRQPFTSVLYETDPFTSAAVIIEQVMAYENIATLLISLMTPSVLTPLFSDIFIWTIISQTLLNKSASERFKEDGIHRRPWLNHLSTFTTQLMAAEHGLDLASLLRYLLSSISSLYDGNYYIIADVISMLPAIIERNGGIPPVPQELTKIQVQCLSGGPLLRLASQHPLQGDFKKIYTKISVRIPSSLTPKLCWTLWNLLGSLSQSLASSHNLKFHIKALSSLIDEIQDLFLHFSSAMGVWIKKDAVLKRAILELSKEKPWKNAMDIVRASHIYTTLNPFNPSSAEGSGIGLFWQLSFSNLLYPCSEYEAIISEYSNDENLHQALIEESALQRASLLSNWDPLPLSKIYSSSETTIAMALERAIIPRSLLSPSDALFCAIWIQRVHQAEWPSHSTLVLLDRLFATSVMMLSGLTRSESVNFGYFLKNIMEWLSSFSHPVAGAISKDRASQLLSKYAIEGSKIGFAPLIMKRVKSEAISNEGSTAEGSLSLMVIDGESSSQNSPSTDFPKSRTTPLSWTELSAVFRKWHIKLYRSFMKILRKATYSSYDVRIRNALVVLTSLVEGLFPVLESHGVALEALIVPLASEEEKNEDIRLLGRRCLSLLRANSSSWISSVSTPAEIPASSLSAATMDSLETPHTACADSPSKKEAKKSSRKDESSPREPARNSSSSSYKKEGDGLRRDGTRDEHYRHEGTITKIEGSRSDRREFSSSHRSRYDGDNDGGRGNSRPITRSFSSSNSSSVRRRTDGYSFSGNYRDSRRY